RAPLHAVVEHHASVEPRSAAHDAADTSAHDARTIRSSGELTAFVYELGDRVVLRLVDRATTASLIQLVND
ncbi:MAG: hypothetical protein ACKOIZ_13980, partial [Actinomycetota bacterium]